MRAAGVLLCFALLAPTAFAQEPAPTAPPRGPADVMNRARQTRENSEQDAREKQLRAAPAPAPALPSDHPPVTTPAEPQGELPQGHPPVGAPSNAADAELPADHPPVPAANGADPHAEGVPVGADPHAGAVGAPQLSRRPLASAEPSKSAAAGSVRVRVLDFHEKPVAGAELSLGVMSADGSRTSHAAKTAADGIHVYEQLAVGERQAYRVNVLHQGAKFSSTPFRLPADQGYEVVIRRLDTTRDASQIALYVGATSVELKDDRLKIVQQVRLFNVGAKAYVFPEGGLRVPLPEGALAFQADEIMTDQHVRAVQGEGFAISGSLPPGEVTLTWGFDLPFSGSEYDLSLSIPWPAFAYRVLADAAPGMTVEVEGLPPPQLQSDRGRRYWLTEIVKSPGDAPLQTLVIRLRGIPGPGPLRFIATGLALVLIGLGVVWARRAPPIDAQQQTQALLARKAELLQRVSALSAEHASGEIGPEFHARELAQLEDELAALLCEQDKARRPA